MLLVVDYSCCIVIQLQLLIMQLQLLHAAMVAASDDYCELLLLYTCHYMPVISRHNVFLHPDAATMFQSIRDKIKFCCSHRPREWACAPVHRVGIVLGMCRDIKAVADLEILKGGFGWHINSAPPKAVRRAAKWRLVRAKRGKFFTCSF